MGIYRTCDIRGGSGDELTPELYRKWGCALGQQVAPHDKFVVGGDVRELTPDFQEALLEGLCAAGVDAVDLGILPTPMVYYAKTRLQAAGCAVVTGAHHAAGINGLKWWIGDALPTGKEVAALARAIKRRKKSAAQQREPTRPRKLDISFDYVACLQETFVDALEAQCHVVLDPMWGVWAGKARRYLNAIFPQSLFATIHNTRSLDFEGGEPDCSRASELHALSDAVYRARAHLGVAYDGDGDRLALVDDEGVALSVEETAWVLLQSLGAELAGQVFVYDARLSDRIVEAARQLGADPIMESGGAARIRTRMQVTQARFGVEADGHFFHRELGGGDDSLWTTCWLLAWLARQPEQSLGSLRRGCPPIYITPELSVPLADEAQTATLEHICAAWSQFPQQTENGVRINTPSGWILVSRSPHEAALTFRCEGIDWQAVDRLLERFCRTLPELGEELANRYRLAMGVEPEYD